MSRPGHIGDVQAEFHKLDRLAGWLDDGFVVPWLGLRFGLDALAGLLPVGGDLAMACPALYIVWKSHRLGAPRRLVVRMLGNVLIDIGIGAVPVLGDVADVFWRGNRRNVRLLRRYLDHAPSSMRP